jgi:hypothetical protein
MKRIFFASLMIIALASIVIIFSVPSLHSMGEMGCWGWSPCDDNADHCFIMCQGRECQGSRLDRSYCDDSNYCVSIYKAWCFEEDPPSMYPRYLACTASDTMGCPGGL